MVAAKWQYNISWGEIIYGLIYYSDCAPGPQITQGCKTIILSLLDWRLALVDGQSHALGCGGSPHLLVPLHDFSFRPTLCSMAHHQRERNHWEDATDRACGPSSQTFDTACHNNISAVGPSRGRTWDKEQESMA